MKRSPFPSINIGATKPCFKAALRDDGVYELLVYEDIGENWWTGEGITAKGIKTALDGAGTFARISLRINSPGGDAFEGIAIQNMLRAQGKPIDVYVDGIAASAASIIAMAGDTITMGSGAMMMVHNAWGGTIGNAADHQKQVNALSAIDDSISQVYASRTGMSATDCKALMNAETWLTAADCVKSGFATGKAKRMDKQTEAALAMARGFKTLARFANVPEGFKAGVACTCDCQSCQDGECAGCMNEVCQDLNCTDCPMQQITDAFRDGILIHNGARAARDLPSMGAELKSLFSIATSRAYGGVADRDFTFEECKQLGLDRPGEGFSARPGIGAMLCIRSARATLKYQNAVETTDISCCVAPYGKMSCDLGGFKEIYEANCFAESLAAGDDARVLFNHDPNYVLGRRSVETAEFHETAEGFCFNVQPPATQWADDLLVSMRRGDISQGSAAFFILKFHWAYEGSQKIRVIEKAKLVEASVTSFAAYESTSATVVEQQAIAAQQEQHYGARLRLLAAV